jgi:hypothetical protein
MSSRQSGLLSNVHDRHGALNIGATDDVRLPYTQLPPENHPNVAKYPPITSLAHGIHMNHDPEQARWHTPDSSKSSESIHKRTLLKTKPEQVTPADGRRTSKVWE